MMVLKLVFLLLLFLMSCGDSLSLSLVRANDRTLAEKDQTAEDSCEDDGTRIGKAGLSSCKGKEAQPKDNPRNSKKSNGKSYFFVRRAAIAEQVESINVSSLFRRARAPVGASETDVTTGGTGGTTGVTGETTGGINTMSGKTGETTDGTGGASGTTSGSGGATGGTGGTTGGTGGTTGGTGGATGGTGGSTGGTGGTTAGTDVRDAPEGTSETDATTGGTGGTTGDTGGTTSGTDATTGEIGGATGDTGATTDGIGGTTGETGETNGGTNVTTDGSGETIYTENARDGMNEAGGKIMPGVATASTQACPKCAKNVNYHYHFHYVKAVLSNRQKKTT